MNYYKYKGKYKEHDAHDSMEEVEEECSCYLFCEIKISFQIEVKGSEGTLKRRREREKETRD